MRLFLLLLLSTWSFAATGMHTATVVETMNAGGYTYMKVRESGEPYWVAVTMTPVKTGDEVTFAEEMWMPNFKSRALNRSFDTILFASIQTASPHAPVSEPVQSTRSPKEVIAKTGNSLHVEEVFAKRYALKDKTVSVRGKVTKVSRGIMQRNWVHIEDGTGDAMTDDLVFTTPDAVDVEAGETVVATGTATVDKDFGYGYFYPVLIENSRFERGR